MNDVSPTREFSWQTSDLKLPGVFADEGKTIEKRQARRRYPTVFTHRVTRNGPFHRDLIAANTYSAKNCVSPVCPRSWIIPSVDRRTSLAIVRSSFLAEPSQSGKIGEKREGERNSFLPLRFLPVCLLLLFRKERVLASLFSLCCSVVSSFWSLILSSLFSLNFCEESRNVHERYV